MLLLNDKYRFLLDFVTDLGWPKVRGEYLVDRQWYSKWLFPFIVINFYRGKKWSSFMLVHVRHEWRSHVLLFHFLPVHSTEERMWLDLMHPSSTSTQTVFRLSVSQTLTVFWSSLMMMSLASSLKFSSNSGAEFWMAYSMLGRSLFMKGERPESISYMQIPWV